MIHADTHDAIRPGYIEHASLCVVEDLILRIRTAFSTNQYFVMILVGPAGWYLVLVVPIALPCMVVMVVLLFLNISLGSCQSQTERQQENITV